MNRGVKIIVFLLLVTLVVTILFTKDHALCADKRDNLQEDFSEVAWNSGDTFVRGKMVESIIKNKDRYIGLSRDELVQVFGSDFFLNNSERLSYAVYTPRCTPASLELISFETDEGMVLDLEYILQ